MAGIRTALTHALVVILVTGMLVEAALGVQRRHLFQRLLTAGPRQRIRFYRNVILVSWISAAFVPAIASTSTRLSARDLGWAWPHGDGIDYVLASWLLLMMVASGLAARRRAPARRAMAASPLLPQNPTERWLAAGVALSAAITEEAVYRGLLIGVGTHLYHMPVVPAALVSLTLFVGAHTYQGRRALPGVVVLGAALTALYVLSGSLLLVVVLHLSVDLVALLLVPARRDRVHAPTGTAPVETGRSDPPPVGPYPDRPVPPLRAALPD
jgi:membrane protease YdiL (CAAX protease family)